MFSLRGKEIIKRGNEAMTPWCCSFGLDATIQH